MKKLRMRFLLSIIYLMGFQSTLFSQEDLQKQIQRVDSLFSQWAKPNSPGASIGIYKEGSLVYSQGYGMSNLEYDVPIKPNSIFHVASISKQFTDFAVLLLEEEGKLSIEEDIRKYMPEIHDFGKTITLRHLMHHTSGFRDQWQLLAIAGWRLDDVITEEHILKMILGQRELNFEPGSQYRYSNSGYFILARIVEKVSGMSFAAFAKERIFEPLEMYDTHVHDDHAQIVPRRTYSYRPFEDGFKKVVLSYANDGATSLFTTAEDMGKWMNNMLSPKLGESFVPRMRANGKLNNGAKINYGFGQSIGAYRGLDYAGHGGADAGFRSHIRWYPEQEFGVVVLSNLGSFNPARKVEQITDIFLKEHLTQEKEEKKEENPRVYTPIKLSADELKKFEGKYTILQFGVNMKLTAKDDHLEVEQIWDGARYQVLPIAVDTFVELEEPILTMAFKTENDEITGFQLTQGTQKYWVKKFVPYVVDPEKLQDFTGRYYCPETDSYYGIILTEEGLTATHNRHADISLRQTSEKSFKGDAWWMSKVDFVRDDSGQVTGFLIGGGRVENLRFNKVE